MRREVGTDINAPRESPTHFMCLRSPRLTDLPVQRSDSSQLSALREQHKLESKGLIVQIHYLKAKFTRENTLRMDLGYQKRYLLVLLGRRERR